MSTIYIYIFIYLQYKRPRDYFSLHIYPAVNRILFLFYFVVCLLVCFGLVEVLSGGSLEGIWVFCCCFLVCLSSFFLFFFFFFFFFLGGGGGVGAELGFLCYLVFKYIRTEINILCALR